MSGSPRDDFDFSTFSALLDAKYATKEELKEIRAAHNLLGLEVGKIQSELAGVRKALDRMSINIERGVWVVLTAVILAMVGQVLIP